jgi:formylglycine-generating enzyme required for sulfatase activity
MGSEKGDANERPVHTVTLTQPFYLGRFEVTQQQWLAVMTNNPSKFPSLQNPVDSVSWLDCQLYLKKLGLKLAGRKFRLPTEAEWEYACRAGAATEFSFGDDAGRLPEYAWFTATSGASTHPVGRKQPNAWGLHDMHGNVFEWCQDWYQGRYDMGGQTDPPGPQTGEMRVLRGGAWNFGAHSCRAAARLGYSPRGRLLVFGFRVVCEITK